MSSCQKINGVYAISCAKMKKFTEENTGRLCSIFYCYMAGDQRCCADCSRKLDGTCLAPCLNHPARCGLELKTGGGEQNVLD